LLLLRKEGATVVVGICCYVIDSGKAFLSSFAVFLSFGSKPPHHAIYSAEGLVGREE